MKKSTLLILLIVTLVPLASVAAPVDAQAALETASQFLSKPHAGRTMVPRNAHALRLVHNEPSSVLSQAVDYYIFDDGGCFVIVSGDDCAQAVLAYGDGTLDMRKLPCNTQWMLDHYKQQMEWLYAHPDARMEPSFTSRTVVEPLLPCTWSQGTPYYDQCPKYHGEYCATGCIATAMAQVMYYWKYPDALPDLPAYTSRTYRIPVPALPGTTLDWDSMLDGYYFRHYTTAQGEAVATLMRYCGQGSSMDYGTDGSGSYGWNQLVGMQVFGYNLSARQLHRDDYSADEWNALMLQDLAEGIPILYTGTGEVGGHAYVIDGFDGSMYHINWGWEGTCDGYFALDAFSPRDWDFSYDQEMLHRLYPEIYNYSGPYDLEVAGVFYKVVGHEATVTYSTPTFNSYEGRVDIPAQVTAGGETYNVTAIGNNAFRGCDGLTAVTLPSTIRHIGKYAFKDCVSLTRLTLPGSVATIDYAAFEGCTGLLSLAMNDGIEEIGYYAFQSCTGLKRLTIPCSIRSIGNFAFTWCDGLSNVTIENDPNIDPEDYYYDGCEIGYAAFAYCRALREVSLGDGVTGIGEAAFYGCNRLEKVTMGQTMDHIDTLAFRYCSSLARIIALPELPPELAGVNCFDDDHYGSVTVCVPEFARDNYICDEIWTRFDSIVNLEDMAIPGDANGDGEVSIADVNVLTSMILTGAQTASADVNGDGEVTVADVNAVIDLILAK